eukprot:EG_transcript_42448
MALFRLVFGKRTGAGAVHRYCRGPRPVPPGDAVRHRAGPAARVVVPKRDRGAVAAWRCFQGDRCGVPGQWASHCAACGGGANRNHCGILTMWTFANHSPFKLCHSKPP